MTRLSFQIGKQSVRSVFAFQIAVKRRKRAQQVVAANAADEWASGLGVGRELCRGSCGRVVPVLSFDMSVSSFISKRSVLLRGTAVSACGARRDSCRCPTRRVGGRPAWLLSLSLSSLTWLPMAVRYRVARALLIRDLVHHFEICKRDFAIVEKNISIKGNRAFLTSVLCFIAGFYVPYRTVKNHVIVNNYCFEMKLNSNPIRLS